MYTKFSEEAYTKSEYNRYGWARANGILNKEEYGRWNSQLKNINAMRKASDGSRIIQTGTKFGIDNVLVYTKGNYWNPVINKVVRINVDVYADYDVDTDIDLIREVIYDKEKAKSDCSGQAFL